MANSSFGSINTALTALQFNRVLMDTANSNVANADTEGYTRRRTDGLTLGAPNSPAMWSKYVGAGEGVLASASQRMTDELLTSRGRDEHAAQSFYDARAASFSRLEAGVNEPGDNGVASALANFRDAWQDLAQVPDGNAERAQVLSAGAALAQALKIQSNNVDAEASDNGKRITVDVNQVNGLAQNLARLNNSIVSGEASGTDVNALLDQRDQTALQLSELTGGKATLQADDTYTFTIGANALVTGGIANTLNVASGLDANGNIVTAVIPPPPATDGNLVGADITFSITDSLTSTTSAAFSLTEGEVGGLTQMNNVDLRQYKSDLNAVARNIADTVNSLHNSTDPANTTPAYTADGTISNANFFNYTATDPANTLDVNITNLADIAVSAIGGAANTDNTIADAIGKKLNAEDDYESLINTLGSNVAKESTLQANQQAMTTQVDNQRDQLSGVDMDEEMSNLMQAQRAYEAAARVMTAVDSMLDTLINHTGLVGL